MNAVSTFDSTKRSLSELLSEVHSGRIQLPDFQRGWVWDDEHIRSLIASVSLSFPIGAVMVLEVGGQGVRFKPRPIEGTPAELECREPETLILDGQQRLTSLYQVLKSGHVVSTRDSRGKKIDRWYYIDMREALDPEIDREDAVLSVPSERMVRGDFGREIELDLSTPVAEFENLMFPISYIFDPAPWRREFNSHWSADRDKSDLYDNFEAKVVDLFRLYQVPVIRLAKSTPKEAVCLVFEKVNTGGVSLTVFELVTASFAAENFQLRDDWVRRESLLKNHYSVLREIQSTDFLQIVTLLATQEKKIKAERAEVPPDRLPGVSCKRKDILKLPLHDYRRWADPAVDGLERAARFLHREKIFRAQDLPYRSQVVPLAAILATLGNDGENDGVHRKIARWFWCGVLGELYGSAIESRFARDLPEVVQMVRNEDEPSTIRDANFTASRLLTLRTRNSAAYKGIYALLMKSGCRDFRTGEPIEAQTFFDDKIDIHHLFPVAWCHKEGIDPKVYNSIINKTALSARTNRQIGGRAPSTYLRTLQNAAALDDARLDAIVRSHRLDPLLLRGDDFHNFYRDRKEKLIAMIEEAMDKRAARDDTAVEERVQEEFEEEVADWKETDEPIGELVESPR